MADVALIFPGQGAQKVGMGEAFYQSSPEAKAIFEQANEAIGDLTSVIFEGPQDKLTSTAYCQPAILATSIAALKALEASDKASNIDVKFTAGLSLGEYSALIAGGAFSFQDGLGLVQKRASFMEQAATQAQGAMSAVMGFGKEKLLEVCEETGAEVANFNSHEQIVITGHKDKVHVANEVLREAGTKVIPLDVSGAFHSSLMEPAADQFSTVLGDVTISNPQVSVISNVDAKPEQDESTIRSNLAAQITSSVQWVDTIEYIADQGVSTFIEIGPGRVLKGLIRKINADLTVHNIQSPEDIESLDI